MNRYLIKSLLIVCVNHTIVYPAEAAKLGQQELVRLAKEQCAHDPNFQKLKNYPLETIRKVLQENPIVPTEPTAPSKSLAEYDKILSQADPQLVRQAKELLDNDLTYQAKIKKACDEIWIIMMQDARFWTLAQQNQRVIERIALLPRPQDIRLSIFSRLPTATLVPVATAQSTPQQPMLHLQKHTAMTQRPQTARKPVVGPQRKISDSSRLSDWDTLPEHEKPNLSKAIGLKVLTVTDKQRKKKED